jgi:hypothetical protein
LLFGGINETILEAQDYMKPWPLVFLLSVLVFALAACFIVDRLTSWPTRAVTAFTQESTENAKKVRDAFVELFRMEPKITINDSVAFDQSKDLLELDIASRETEVTRNTSQTWFGSTKTIRIRTRYRVKAGFDLSEKLEVAVDDRGATVKAPHATILSVEPLSTSVEELKEGFWNKIQPQDIESELKAMPMLAREKESTLPAEAEQNFARLLSEKVANLPVHVEIQQDQKQNNAIQAAPRKR